MLCQTGPVEFENTDYSLTHGTSTDRDESVVLETVLWSVEEMTRGRAKVEVHVIASHIFHAQFHEKQTSTIEILL